MERFARLGVLPDDSRDEALRKETLVLFSSVVTLLSFAWVGTYAALGLYPSAAIPLAFQVFCVVNLAVFARQKRYRFFRASTLALVVVLPFLLQLSLGGFLPSSAVVLWSFMAPLGALLFSGRDEAVRWFAAFVGVIVLSAAIDPLLTNAADIPHRIAIAFFALNILGVTGTAFFLLYYFVRERERAAALIAAERERSERLLLNVLPAPIAERLKSGESPIADRASEAGVLFADIVGFTPLSERLHPDELLRLLDEVFSLFDALVAEHGLEKIKTIGDAYMVASGLLGGGERHAEELGETALAMHEVISRMPPLQVRIGMDVGPVVAGVIGRRKFIYDLGRHGQHCQPDGGAGYSWRDPGDRAGIRAARTGFHLRRTRDDRNPGERPDADVSSRRFQGRCPHERRVVLAHRRRRGSSVSARRLTPRPRIRGPLCRADGAPDVPPPQKVMTSSAQSVQSVSSSSEERRAPSTISLSSIPRASMQVPQRPASAPCFSAEPSMRSMG